ncbi:peroxisomal biogenesis factor [Coniophora puteana RWD-64-598 SS2]|uniref:Peroxisomal biogenesis factor n=1 Tax=Coniophora puteana (strain RWD-64-598) TaxID=741705 RepID=A0A5M3N5Q0_CONPW|nr:peroxisomal biogenesis factor [Coniophora puteana RWD-64-598 SS2]EIW86597.1 peroxisomal biogenesis factor [Coniophora puteana RWD-64-598 SS2]
MTTLASQVVLHPYVGQSLKYGGNNVGRDKLYRTIQYFARFLAWYLLSRGDKAEAARWNALKSHLALGRKLMRLGKPVEHLQAALRAAQSASHAAEQLTTIGRQLGYFGYLTYDAIVWANTVKFINLKPDTAAKVTKTSNRFWLAGILFSITHNLLKLGRLAQEAKGLRATQTWGEKDLADEAQREVKVLANASMRSDVRHQFAIDLLDVWIPAFNLGLVGVSDGFVGIAGMISSIMGVRAQWNTINGIKKN